MFYRMAIVKIRQNSLESTCGRVLFNKVAELEYQDIAENIRTTSIDTACKFDFGNIIPKVLLN